MTAEDKLIATSAVTVALTRALLNCGALKPDILSRELAAGRVFLIGRTTTEVVEAYDSFLNALNAELPHRLPDGWHP